MSRKYLRDERPRAFDEAYRNPDRLSELINTTEADRQATLIELSVNRDRARGPDESTKYRVTLPATGEVLMERARAPEHEAARALLDRGITGRLVTCWAGRDIIAMRMDIEKAAGRTVVETRKRGPEFAKYRPHPSGDREDP